MSWDEVVFGAFYRAVQAVRAPRRSPEVEARAASLDALRPRLALVAAACAGRAVEIGVSEGGGGVRGAVILLPERLDFAPTPEANEQAYLLRVIFAATTLRLGLAPPPGASPAVTALATLLAVPATLRAIEEDLPGAFDLHRDLSPSALAARPPWARLGPGAARLEALAQRLLGRPWDALAAAAPASAVAFARRAAEEAPADAAALRRVTAAYGGEVDGGVLAPVALWGELMCVTDGGVAKVDGAGDAAVGAGATERRGKPRDHVRRVELSDDPLEENPLVHSFEKLHTADVYQGGKKRVDGADELAEHADALEELDLRDVIRSPERAHSLLRVDAMFEGAAGDLEGEPGAGGIPYDEWEEKTRAYRPGWCSVFVETARSSPDHAAVAAGVRAVLHRHRGQVLALREKLERIEAKRAWRSRQPDGPEVDTDAVVDRFAALAAGHSGADKLYLARRPHAPGLAVLILVDRSLSSDAWVGGHRVLDVAKDSLVVLGEVLSRAEAEVGVAAFHSNTRRDCRFTIIKGFAEPWACAPARLATVEPAGYTRIGPALRHATTLLERCDARRKLLLLVSDGKPTDYDRYEGRYGIADVRRAVQEATERGIRTFGLAIEKDAQAYLPRMFGPGGHEILPRPDALADALARLTGELCA
jgi:hypothetical protein